MDPEKIEEFYSFKVLKPVKQSSYAVKGRFTPSGKWKQLKDSPVYKGDNTLRSYQLEGLNWLMYWYLC